VLVDIQSRGLKTGPSLCVGDGALGFWKAVSVQSTILCEINLCQFLYKWQIAGDFSYGL
jgi:transposase-like protein